MEVARWRSGDPDRGEEEEEPLDHWQNEPVDIDKGADIVSIEAARAITGQSQNRIMKGSEPQ